MELLVVGGDKRHAALCELARARGWHVMSMGLPGSLPCAGLADAAVLPMPYAREGRVPAPLLSDAPDIVSVLEHVRPGARVYCGGADEALNMLAQEKQLKIIDLYKDEAFARRGALPSAEGAIYALMRERDEITMESMVQEGFVLEEKADITLELIIALHQNFIYEAYLKGDSLNIEEHEEKFNRLFEYILAMAGKQ